ncbi:lanthionine synthetase C family protein [Kribbella catacumbae]|uniref:lanthionine synthetase C family protein n=1 Tax=Kribbella catacumbae TaxID=460086 RepID=UPI0003654ECB|nr:lanthionine synthetase C family protein [Kribbella catacumbae]
MTQTTATLQTLVDDITTSLLDPATMRPAKSGGHQYLPQSLAGGAAGVALLHSEHTFTRSTHSPTLHAWLTTAARGNLNGSTSAGLFFGVPALAFVTAAATEATGHYRQSLTQLTAATQQVTRARLDAAHARIDRGELPALAEFDLIRGLTGLGAYHLHRQPDHDVTRDVLTYLVRLTEPNQKTGLPGWWTNHGPTGQPPSDFPGGHGNFGLAHGITGPLALLSLALRAGIAVPGHLDAIARICQWLDDWQQDHPAGPWWPRTITLDEVRAARFDQAGPLQPSWCYGTPGIARSQQLAGLATGDHTRRRAAETALLGCITDPTQLARVDGPTLCHGSAGILQTTWRVARDAETDDLTAELPGLADLLREHLQTAPHSTELLEGSAGAALAALTAVTSDVPHSGWDVCMLLA